MQKKFIHSNNNGLSDDDDDDQRDIFVEYSSATKVSTPSPPKEIKKRDSSFLMNIGKQQQQQQTTPLPSLKGGGEKLTNEQLKIDEYNDSSSSSDSDSDTSNNNKKKIKFKLGEGTSVVENFPKTDSTTGKPYGKNEFPQREDGIYVNPPTDVQSINKYKEETGNRFQKEWIDDNVERRKILEADKNYQFLEILAGKVNTEVERLYEQEDISSRLRTERLRQQQTSQVRQQSVMGRNELISIRDEIESEISELISTRNDRNQYRANYYKLIKDVGEAFYTLYLKNVYEFQLGILGFYVAIEDGDDDLSKFDEDDKFKAYFTFIQSISSVNISDLIYTEILQNILSITNKKKRAETLRVYFWYSLWVFYEALFPDNEADTSSFDEFNKIIESNNNKSEKIDNIIKELSEFVKDNSIKETSDLWKGLPNQLSILTEREYAKSYRIILLFYREAYNDNSNFLYRKNNKLDITVNIGNNLLFQTQGETDVQYYTRLKNNIDDLKTEFERIFKLVNKIDFEHEFELPKSLPANYKIEETSGINPNDVNTIIDNLQQEIRTLERNNNRSQQEDGQLSQKKKDLRIASNQKRHYNNLISAEIPPLPLNVDYNRNDAGTALFRKFLEENKKVSDKLTDTINTLKERLKQIKVRIANLGAGIVEIPKQPDLPYEHRLGWVMKPENSGILRIRPIVIGAIVSAYDSILDHVDWAREVKDVEIFQRDSIIRGYFADVVAAKISIAANTYPKQYLQLGMKAQALITERNAIMKLKNRFILKKDNKTNKIAFERKTKKDRFTLKDALNSTNRYGIIL